MLRASTLTPSVRPSARPYAVRSLPPSCCSLRALHTWARRVDLEVGCVIGIGKSDILNVVTGLVFASNPVLSLATYQRNTSASAQLLSLLLLLLLLLQAVTSDANPRVGVGAPYARNGDSCHVTNWRLRPRPPPTPHPPSVLPSSGVLFRR